jgi:hypothetical protein
LLKLIELILDKLGNISSRNLSLFFREKGRCSDTENGFVVLSPKVSNVAMSWLYDNASDVDSFHKIERRSFSWSLLDFKGIFGHWHPINNDIFAYLWFGVNFLKIFSDFQLNFLFFYFYNEPTTGNNAIINFSAVEEQNTTISIQQCANLILDVCGIITDLRD